MSKRASPAVIGAFVVAGLGLALIAVVVVGSGRLFRDTARMVAYFDGSVVGLRKGAPVKFRGIEIGSVHDIRINMSGAIRDPRNVRIPVVLDIDEDRLTAEGVRGYDLNDRDQVMTMVSSGLRAQLDTESLVTGVRYVSLDIQPDTPAVLVNDRSVAYPEIPSVKNPAEQIPDKVNQVLSNLSEVDVAGITDSLKTILADAHQLLGSPHVTHALAGFDALTENLNRTVLQVRKAVRDLEPLGGELEQTTGSARQLVAPDGPLATQLDATLEELKAAARSMRRLADQLSRDPGSILRGGPS
jgi:paraquat-inducible protein B